MMSAFDHAKGTEALKNAFLQSEFQPKAAQILKWL